MPKKNEVLKVITEYLDNTSDEELKQDILKRKSKKSCEWEITKIPANKKNITRYSGHSNCPGQCIGLVYYENYYPLKYCPFCGKPIKVKECK